MTEGTRMSHDRPDAGNLYPYLLAATGGLYTVHGRARFPESAKPPAQFIGGRMTWQPDEGDVWRFEAQASGNAPGDSTIAVYNCGGHLGTSEIELFNRAIMDALWASGCRAARVDSYQWQAHGDGAYTLTNDLVMRECDDDGEVIDDTPTRVVSRSDLADTMACLRAVYGPALEVGRWERSPAGNLVADVRLVHVEAVAVEEVAP